MFIKNLDEILMATAFFKYMLKHKLGFGGIHTIVINKKFRTGDILPSDLPRHAKKAIIGAGVEDAVAIIATCQAICDSLL